MKKIIGLIYYILLCIRYGNYNASLKIYINYQINPKSYLCKCYIFHSNLGSAKLIKKRINFLNNNIHRTSFSTGVKEQYFNNPKQKTYNLYYKNKNFLMENNTIKNQQRGLTLDHVEKIIKNHSISTIAEFGCGNGDVLSYLAIKNKNHKFFGIDFHVHNAELKNEGINNLKFIKGYIVDILLQNINFDLIFCSSTLICFLPKEIENFFRILSKSNNKFIILNEPHWGPIKQENNNAKFSYHIENNVFFHNYSGYLRHNNFQLTYYESKTFRNKYHARPFRFSNYNNIIIAKNKNI